MQANVPVLYCRCTCEVQRWRDYDVGRRYAGDCQCYKGHCSMRINSYNTSFSKAHHPPMWLFLFVKRWLSDTLPVCLVSQSASRLIHNYLNVIRNPRAMRGFICVMSA